MTGTPWKGVAHDYHVNEALCIDSGLDIWGTPYFLTWIDVDPTGLARNYNGDFDMGAFENQ